MTAARLQARILAAQRRATGAKVYMQTLRNIAADIRRPTPRSRT